MQVPTTDTATEIRGNIPNIKPAAPEYQDYANQQNAALGQATQRFGEAATDIALQMRENITKARVNDALNQVDDVIDELTNDKDNGYKNLHGKNALELPGGMSLQEKGTADLDAKIGEIAQGFSTREQIALFASAVEGRRNQFISGIRQHVLKENNVYQDSVNDGQAQIGLRNMAQADTPEQIIAGANQAVQAQADKYLRAGLSPDEALAKARELVSPQFSAAIAQKVDDGDYLGAQSIFSAVQDYLDPDSIAKTRKLISSATAEADADSIGKQLAQVYENGKGTITVTEHVMTGGGGKGGDPYQTFYANMPGREGTAHNPRSTAYGHGQFISGTWLDQMYSLYRELFQGHSLQEVRDNKNLSQLKNQILALRTNKKYADKATEHYAHQNGAVFSKSGVPTTAGTLYGGHALGGSTFVQVYKASPNTPLVNIVGQKVMNANPQWSKLTTGQFVQLMEKQMGGGSQMVVRQKNITFTSREQVDAYLQSLPAEKRKAVMVSFNQASSMIENTKKAREEDNLNAAYTALEKNGGDWNAVPPSIRNSIPPDKLGTVFGVANAISSGQNHTDPYFYMDLISHPEKITDVSDSTFMGYKAGLSDNDFKSLYYWRTKKNKPDDSWQSLPSVATPYLNARLKEIGIDSKDVRTAAFQKSIIDALFAAQQSKGKKLTDLETRQFIDSALMQKAQANGANWLKSIFGGEEITKKPITDVEYYDIPKETRKTISDSYQKQYGKPPTESQVLSIYYKSEYARRKK